MCVCLSAIISSELTPDLRLIFCACYLWPWLGPPQSGGVVICYVFPVLWMTSYFAHKLRLLDVAARLRQRGSLSAGGLARRNTRCRQATCSQGCSGRVEYL